MKKLKVGIVGYGNLGKATEKMLLNEDVDLVGIFSRRKVDSKYSSKIFSRDELKRFQDKIDLLILCGGSQNDLLVDAPHLLKNFNIINTFDNHKLIRNEYEKLDKIAKEHNKMAIISCGWDPGLFSIERALFSAISKKNTPCFYGKGVSLGHTQAVKRIKGVIDAISFTLPDKIVLEEARKGNTFKPKHKRKVFVVADKDQDRISNEILSMPNYFKGEDTSVEFVSRSEIKRLQSSGHKGEIVSVVKEKGFYEKLNLRLSTNNNAILTAKILMCYVRNFEKLKNKFGCCALTPLHIAPIDLLLEGDKEAVEKYC